MKLDISQPPSERPLMIFDGDCGFCRSWIARWHDLTGDRIDYEPFQKAAERFPEIPVERFRHAVHLIEPNGRVSTGAEAVFRTLGLCPGKGWTLWTYEHAPGVAAVTEWAYRIVARHRAFFDRMTLWFWGRDLRVPRYRFARWVFLRVLGLVYLCAFVSLWVQVKGLIGEHGILPAHQYLGAVRGQLGPIRYWYVPTVLWFGSSNAALEWLCGAGAAVSVGLIIGFAPVLCLVLLWAFYLSLVSVGNVFLGYQWDVLLLETGFLAIFFAPGRWLPGLSKERSPSPAILFLLRWLLFRLMFLSGIRKLLSGDEAWRHLTALRYHYETQPLPTWIGYFAHQLPGWFQSLSVIGVFVIEIGLPFLIFLPRRPRVFAFFGLAGLQILIALTDNFGFFNLLTLGLCVLVLDDAVLHRWMPWRIRNRWQSSRKRWLERRGKRALNAAVTVAILGLSGTQLVLTQLPGVHLPHAVRAPLRWVAPLESVNTYGLFTVMTTTRPEILIQGSDDGRTWKTYEFRWKPGELDGRPRFVEPHMPRLDWQMWFAALGQFQTNPWFHAFLQQLLEGSPDVLALMAKNPFPNHPPRFIRAELYDYRFTSLKTLWKTGDWWTRSRLGAYSPTVTLGRRGPGTPEQPVMWEGTGSRRPWETADYRRGSRDKGAGADP